jgi:hypothetical protein
MPVNDTPTRRTTAAASPSRRVNSAVNTKVLPVPPYLRVVEASA